MAWTFALGGWSWYGRAVLVSCQSGGIQSFTLVCDLQRDVEGPSTLRMGFLRARFSWGVPESGVVPLFLSDEYIDD